MLSNYCTSSKTELVNNFGDFFSDMIAVLRNELANISIYDNQLSPVELSTQCVEFRVFQTVTEQEVENIVDSMAKNLVNSTLHLQQFLKVAKRQTTCSLISY
jgi:uncharacterized protein (UPF0305 family)